jgi:DNA-directed RNA polymerase
MVYSSELTKSKLVSTSKPVTIRLPQNRLNKMAIKRSFMPNLIHSLDASNIHLLIPKLTDQPLYTVHDCFATTLNNMSKLELFVKEAFIEIYFRDGNYLKNMHNNLIEQIKTHSKDYFVNNNGEEKVIINEEEFTIPKLPYEFISNEHNKLFINGLLKSKYFIS